MTRQEDGNTRYFMDLDVGPMTILRVDFAQRQGLAVRRTAPEKHRVFLTLGQYHQLIARLPTEELTPRSYFAGPI